jgi:hypothetical protein
VLAKHIREGTNWLEDGAPDIPPNNIHNFYTELWGESGDVIIPFNSTSPIDDRPDTVANTAISAQEVKARINRLKTETACGPDGIIKKHLARTSVREALRLLFNIVLASGKQPSAWSLNRTFLVLKMGKDPTLIDNYRPITISSLLCRIPWGINDHRLREQFSFSPRQKGFVHEPGCFRNVNIINEVLRDAKTKQGITVLQLDISKVFDTIPLEAIEPALRRLGVPHEIRTSATAYYERVTTDINHRGTTTKITLKRGVKQGDPLSPFIFNAIMDPLLEQLELPNDTVMMEGTPFRPSLCRRSPTTSGYTRGSTTTIAAQRTVPSFPWNKSGSGEMCVFRNKDKQRLLVY